MTKDLLLFSVKAHSTLHSCPCRSQGPLTSKLIFPHTQALPVRHPATGSGSHLDSSLPLTAFAQAK